MSLKNTLLLFASFLCSFSYAVVYRSCSEALAKEKTSKVYDIQPFYQSKTSNIYCEILNDTLGMSYLDHNAEQIAEVKGFEERYSYKKTIIYENFGDAEVDAFLKTVLDCSQGIWYHNSHSASHHHGALFWDNLFVSGEAAADGICHCFVSYNCLQNSNPNLGCLNKNDKVTLEEGPFAVKSSRLPLRIIYFGDTIHSEEWVKYKIWKLKCKIKLMAIRLKVPIVSSDCLQYESEPIQYKLMDSNKETCIKYNSNFLHLEIETVFNITKLKIFGKNLQENKLTFFILDKYSEHCKQKNDLNFECQSSDFLIFQIFSPEISLIELCEIQIS